MLPDRWLGRGLTALLREGPPLWGARGVRLRKRVLEETLEFRLGREGFRKGLDSGLGAVKKQG